MNPKLIPIYFTTMAVADVLFGKITGSGNAITKLQTHKKQVKNSKV
jgi:hypothetical protein